MKAQNSNVIPNHKQYIFSFKKCVIALGQLMIKLLANLYKITIRSPPRYTIKTSNLKISVQSQQAHSGDGLAFKHKNIL